MDLSESDIQALTNIGLTKLEAKVYLTLVRSGGLTAKSISNVSGIARQDIYRLTNDLMKKALVKKELNIPNNFEAIRLAEGIKILENEKDKERLESKKKTQITAKIIFFLIVRHEFP